MRALFAGDVRYLTRGLLLCILLVAACAVDHEAKPDAREHAVALGTPAQAATNADPALAWVLMKDQADLSQARAISDWAARGAAVRDALLATATSKQDPVQRFLASRGVKFDSFWIVNALRVRADGETIEALKHRQDVAQVSAERLYSIPEPQPSAATSSSGALPWGITSIHAPQAWQSFGSHGEGIVVGSIDSGAQFDHPALVRQYRGNHGASFDHNFNWFDPSRVCGNPSLAPCDNTAHGTHTMGTLVGLDESGEHQIGVAPGARWIAAKGCEDHWCSTYALLSAAQWMLAPTDLNGEQARPELRPHIVSNSWGSVPGDTYLEPLVQAWVAAGMFPVFAAGNNGPTCGTAYSPSDFPESYSVAAYDASDTIAWFSGRGSGNLGATKPNIAAPGVGVLSSVPGDGYYAFDGTSMATPHVAGAVALLWSAAPGLLGDIAATRALLDKTALDMGDWNCGGDKTDNATWGEGRLDVHAALTKATSPTARGLLVGTVRGPAEPLANATITARAEGQPEHFILTNADGSYRLGLPVGRYSVEVRAFGYATQTLASISISQDAELSRDITLDPAQRAAISGSISDERGAAVPFATVSIAGTPIEPVTADVSGKYVLSEVPLGNYVLSFDAYGCYEQQSVSVTLTRSSEVNVVLSKRRDAYGYGCQVVGDRRVSADQPLMTAGDDESREVDLPFPFVYYGKEYKRVTVSINGAVSFQPKPFVFANGAIPSPAPPNAAIYALWHNYVLDDASAVFTKVLGAAPRRLVVFEWRNVPVHPSENIDRRFNFALLLHESGEITLQYAGSGSARRYGELATIGIEDDAGSDGLMYSLYRSSVVPGMSIRYSTPASGVVRGTLTNENDGMPLAGVGVAAMSGSERLRETKTDKQGQYLLQLPVGAATLVASAKNYVTQERSIRVSSGQRSVVDFALRTAAVELAPSAFELVLPAGKSSTRALSLKNVGSAALRWSLQQSAPGEHSPGEIITSFQPGLLLPWGVGIAEQLWVSDLYAQRTVELTSEGVATGRAWPTEWPGISLDMAYDSVHKLMCQVDYGPGYSIGVPCWDPATGKVEASISGNYPWTTVPQRGLAYNASDDSFYIGGPDLGVIYHIAGLSHDQPGEILSQCQPPDRGISGLAWNASKHILWEATNSDSDTIFELNPEDCSVLSAIAHPAPGKNGGGIELDEHGNIWMVAQLLGTVYLVESGVPTFSSVPWLSSTPSMSTLAQAASTTVTLTVNSADVDPGLHEAALFLESNAARSPSLRVPVRLIVTDYQRAIDCGSDTAHTDSQLEAWSADRAYAAGEWGYIGESHAERSARTIADTDDPVLYESVRLDLAGYRFDNVPNGVYAVELRFAQPSDLDPEPAQFDVIIEDDIVLAAYDPSYRNGQDHADDHTFYVPVSDGQLDIRFSARSGRPMLSALRVTHRPDR